MMFAYRPKCGCPSRIWTWLLIGIVACVGCGWQGLKEGPKDQRAEASNRSSEGRFHETADTLTEPSADNLEHARAAFDRARAFEESGQRDGALAEYTDAIRRFEATTAKSGYSVEARQSTATPRGIDLGDAYCRYGKLLNGTDDFDSAIEAFSKALPIDRECVEAYVGRGIAFLGKGFRDLAVDDLTEALRLKPTHAEALYHRARAALMKGDVARAADDCRLSIRINPKQARAYFLLGSVQSSASPPDFDGAVGCLKEAVRLDPQLAEEVNSELAKIWFEQAVGLHRARKKDEANIALAKAKNLDSAYGPMFEERIAQGERRTSTKLVVPDLKALEFGQLGFDHITQRQFDEAIEAFTAATEIDPKYAEPYYGRGLAFLEKGLPDSAIADFSEAIRLDRFHVAALSERARAYTMAGDCYMAVDDATRAIRLNPRLAKAYQYRGMAYLKQGKFDLAIADSRELASLDVSLGNTANELLAEAHRGRGLSELSQRQPQAAVADLKEAIRLKPSWDKQIRPRLIEGWRACAMERAEHREMDEAIEALREALQLDSSNAESLQSRGLLYFKMEKWDLAIRDLQKVADLDPGLAARARWQFNEARRWRDAGADADQ